MDKIRSALSIRESLGEGRGSSLVSLMVGWFELITITILCLSCEVFVLYKAWKIFVQYKVWKFFVMYKVWKFSIFVSHVHTCLYYSFVKDEYDKNGWYFVKNQGVDKITTNNF